MIVFKSNGRTKDQGAAVSGPPVSVSSAAWKPPLPGLSALIRLILFTVCLQLAVVPSKAESIEHFFHNLGRRIRNAIEQGPEHHSRGHKSTAHHDTSAKHSKSPESGAHPAANSSEPSGHKKFSPTVRPASAAPGSAQGAPFAAPVPGKKGYVTSPFSSDGNYIDVSAFPPGAEVKDPYTGKVFRVP